jgi:hypothetical protein
VVDNLFTKKGSTEGREAIASQFLDSLNKLVGGTVFFPLFHDVKDQFNPGGNAKFVINAEQIIAHRVLRDAMPLCNFFVRQRPKMLACLPSSAACSAVWKELTWDWCCSWHRRGRGGRLFNRWE